ncbi:MAG TPA: hypothetical protein DD648_02035, partial [Candidatus Omnitrophica bacterium]|nr:hypothetical protein [Candidatus Omnitrophota bacterium]
MDNDMQHTNKTSDSPLIRKESLTEKIIEFSAKNKFIVLIFVAAMMIGAVWSLKNIPLDAIPDL